MGQNICDCPNPPGGRAVCDDSQLAICFVKDGVVETRCVSVPKAVRNNEYAFAAWVMSIVSGEKRPVREPTSAEIDILERGEYVDAVGRTVTFRLPTENPLRGWRGLFA
jgi:hypothetical protein